MTECVVVCVGPSPSSERLVHGAKRLADSLRARWFAVHVAPTHASPFGDADRDRVETHLALAETLGAECAYVVGESVGGALLEFAREHGATRIVAGKPTHPRWRDRLRPSLLDHLIRESGSIEVHIIAPTEDAPAHARDRSRPASALTFVRAMAAVLVATGLGALVREHVSTADLAMLYLAAIVVAALGGRSAGLLASALSIAAFNFFFIPPRFTFAVADGKHVITFAVMFVVGTAAGTIVARLRHAAAISRQRERRTSALLAFTSQAAAARDIADIATAVIAHVEDALQAPAVVLVPNDTGELTAVAGIEPRAPQELAVIAWAHQHGQPAGRGTTTNPEARLLALPLWDGDASEGIVAVQIDRARRPLTLDVRTLLDAITRQAAVAIARLRLGRTAQTAALRAHTEELRSSLLSTVSHDLRTPLAIISGLASTLRDGAPTLTADQRDSLSTIDDEATRLGTILTNLLALTRAETAAVQRDWVPLEEVVGAALARCDAQLEGRAVELAVDPDAGVRVDPVLFEQLVWNLIENAAKHTPAGSPILIRARMVNDEAVLEVSDRGPGLPAGPPERLFEKFVRGPGVRTIGAGLGLAVCRGIAHAHGARLEAESRDGGGATFRVSLAARNAPPTPQLVAS